MAILKLIKHISPSMRAVFVDGLLYKELSDHERLSLVLRISMDLSVPDQLPERICVVDAETGDLLGLQGVVY
ncbi:MAG TPA: hypothetical protein VKP65_23350 [Rhodothermales bacterium]|nr:hypothetical protein [Rhodothermales bacterium]